MKAAVYTRYGPPDVVQIMDVEKPVPKDDEVLIRVRAASVNPYDWHFMRGMPYFLRLQAGLRKPKVTRLGVDAAGQVETVGRNVTQFKPGGPCGVCMCFRDEVGREAAKRDLRASRFRSCGTISGPKTGQRYDLILDNVGNHSLSECRRVLNPKGICVIPGAPKAAAGFFLTRAIAGPLLSRFASQKFTLFLAKINKEDLTFVGELMKTGKVTSVIDKRYSLTEALEAIRYLDAGHARGKVVITLSDAKT